MDNKTLYLILDIKYVEMFGRFISLNSNSNADLYPNDWFLSEDYEYKVKVLVEALNKNIKIEDTELYQKNVEGPRM